MRLLKIRLSLSIVAVLSVVIFGVFTADYCFGFPRGTLKAMRMPPWEVQIQMSAKEQSFRFPVSVENIDKPAEMNTVLPVMGTAIKIRLERYLPDLKILIDGVTDANGGLVIQLKAEGQNLNQEVWLSSTDVPRRSISSSIGQITATHVRDSEVLKSLVKEMRASRAVGVLSVMDANGVVVFESVARVGKEITVPKTEYKVKMLKYLPHFSVDMKTKEVTSFSDKPVNPALQVRVSGAGEPQDQWLWSNIDSPPHETMQEKLHLKFTSFDLGSSKGTYILAGSSQEELWSFFFKDGKIQVEKVELEKAFPFADKAYTFKINKYFCPAVIKTEWENGTEEMLNPGIITSIIDGTKTERGVMEFGKAFQYNSEETGTIMLLYRRVQQMK